MKICGWVGWLFWFHRLFLYSLLMFNLVICYLLVLYIMRELFWEFQIVQESVKICTGKVSSLERLLMILISHVGHNSCTCPIIDPPWSFSSQILTIPFLWALFPYLKEVVFQIFSSNGYGTYRTPEQASYVVHNFWSFCLSRRFSWK